MIVVRRETAIVHLVEKMSFAHVAPLGRMQLAVTSLVLAFVGVACGSTPEGPTDALRDDARAISALLADDVVLLALRDADEAVADDLPVRGAERLRSGALPAARRQVARARELETHSPDGAALRDEAVRALEARRAALEGYADVLERGLLEDLDLAVSLRTQREAEAAVDALLARLEEIQSPAP